jgi:Homeodomain-like domain
MSNPVTVILDGHIRDAEWCVYRPNATYSQRRTNADKRRAVVAALMHPQAAGLSDTEIARNVRVDSKTVSNWRRRLAVGVPIPAESAQCDLFGGDE